MGDKIIKTVLGISLLLWPAAVAAQPDTLHLEAVTVTTALRQGELPRAVRMVTLLPDTLLQAMPVTSLQEALLTVPGADIRQRGPQGVQADLSIRGGTFDQVLVMVDGIPVSDPQSGHHNLNIPVPLTSIAAVEVLKGGASAQLGPDAFSGAVNVVTRLPQENYFETDLTYGQYGYYNAGFSGGIRQGRFSAMADVHHSASAGYRDNTDFVITQTFLRARYGSDHTWLDLLGGWTQKAFGANSFYSPAFPQQYEEFSAGLGALRFTAGRKVQYRQSVYWRRGRDLFTLFRHDAPAWYAGPNYHRTNTAGTDMQLIIPERIGKTRIGIEYRQENILSTVLGEETADTVAVPGAGVWYDHRAKRNIFSAYAGQKILAGRFSVSGGLLLNRTGDYDWKVYGGLDVAVRVGERWRLFAALNQSLRYPTFTDLYYHDPAHAGNPALKPEKALTLEGGVRKNGEVLQAAAGVYVRKGEKLIDWVRGADSLRWHSMNHTSLTTTGLELSAALDVRRWTGNAHCWLRRISFSYAFATADKESGAYLSKYVMDYLHHQAVLQADHLLPGKISAWWQFILRDRAGSYQDYPSGDIIPYEPSFLVNVRISYHLWLTDIFVNINNLLNTNYVDNGNLPAPGIWVSGGVRMKLEARRLKVE